MNSPSHPAWLTVHAGSAPLLLCMPHTGTDIPPELEPRFVSPWLARKDTDWWVERLYAFGEGLGASLVRTALSRSVIDANRDPTGASLYPGQATTELCPTTTFDGEPLYRADASPGGRGDRAAPPGLLRALSPRRQRELARLRALHPCVVVYDCHSIRSQVPRLFPGTLPHFNLGTFSGASCARELTHSLEGVCDASGFSRVSNGRFKGGYTTRHYGRPAQGVHAVQMELACRGYLAEPEQAPDAGNWPPPWDGAAAAALQGVLVRVLQACLEFADGGHNRT